jgi:hypothetical protein
MPRPESERHMVDTVSFTSIEPHKRGKDMPQLQGVMQSSTAGVALATLRIELK